jgi:cyclophilin family peptidyl-prolyl cis-trans isomerase
LSLLALAPLRADQTKTPAPAAPVIVLETAKGTVEIEMYPADAPKTVEMILGLVRNGFYRGQRFHRVTTDLVQIGDPQTRDMTKQESWGKLGSGVPVGVSEVSRKHPHVRGSMGLAHTGDPKYADSQFYILKSANSSLDGKYVVVGHVTKGMEVVDKIEVADVIRNATVR